MIKSNYRKKIKKDYQCKNLRNPFFHKNKKGSLKKKVKLFLVSLFFFVAVLIWFFGFSSFWRLSNIEVSGLTRHSDNELKQLIYNQSESHIYLFFKENNTLFFDSKKARQQILTNFNFANVEIKIKLPKTIEIKVSERPYAFIFEEGSVNYYASIDAYLIKETTVNPEDLKKYFILENKTSISLIKNNKIDIPSEYLNFVLNLSRALSNQSDLQVEKFEIDQGYRSISVKFVNGPTAYFNTKLIASEQLDRLILVKKEKIKDNFSKVNYIDLRYGDRIFIN